MVPGGAEPSCHPISFVIPAPLPSEAREREQAVTHAPWRVASGVRTFACELNFRRGEAIDDPQLVTIQSGINDRWSALQRQHDEAGGRRAELPISVAQAIMEDFEPYLP